MIHFVSCLFVSFFVQVFSMFGHVQYFSGLCASELGAAGVSPRYVQPVANAISCVRRFVRLGLDRSWVSSTTRLSSCTFAARCWTYAYAVLASAKASAPTRAIQGGRAPSAMTFFTVACVNVVARSLYEDTYIERLHARSSVHSVPSMF